MIKLKGIFTATLCAALMLSSVACSTQPQMAETFIVCDDMDEAFEITDLYACVPETIDGYSKKIISASEEKGMVQILYLEDGKDSDGEICIRKANGMNDISDDTSVYPEESTTQVLDFEVTLKGSDSKINLATWTAYGWSYSISSTKSLDKDAMVSLIKYVGDEAIGC